VVCQKGETARRTEGNKVPHYGVNKDVSFDTIKYMWLEAATFNDLVQALGLLVFSMKKRKDDHHRK